MKMALQILFVVSLAIASSLAESEPYRNTEYFDLTDLWNELYKLEDQLQKNNDQCNERIQTLSDEIKGNSAPDVAFSASLKSAQKRTALRQPIKFERVLTNIGNAYDPGTGKFTAPVDGTYVFYWSILNDKSSDIHTALSSSKRGLGDTYNSRSTGLHNQGSGLVVEELEAGTSVWVEKAEPFGNFLQVFSSFSGFRLKANNPIPLIQN